MAFKRILLSLTLLLAASPAAATVLSLKNKPAYVPGEILVRLKEGAKADDKAKVMAAGKAKSSFLPNVFKIKLDAGRDVLKAVEDMKSNPALEYVQPNYIYRVSGCALPAVNTYYASPYDWPFRIIQADLAWTLLSTWPACPPGAPAAPPVNAVTVAILDTGISRNHPDLRNVPLIGFNAINASGQEVGPSLDSAGVTASNDDYGHGTYVAGIVAAEGNLAAPELAPCNSGSAKRMTGLAPGVTLMAVKVLDETGYGTSESIALGTDFAVSHGARVLNFSLGGSGQDMVEQTAIEAALAAGCVVVASSGNDSDLPYSQSPVSYPAANPGVIAVGATDKNDNVVFYSNGGEGLDIVAPGGAAIDLGSAFSNAAVDIFSSFLCPLSPAAIADGGFETAADANYGVASGTSASAPYVSGAAALVFCLYPNLTNVQVAKQIIDNTDSLNNNAGWDKKSGYGRLNVYKTLNNPVGSGQAVTYTKTFNSPNPFYTDRQTSTNITLAITQPEAVQLTIYDTSGEVVLSKSYAASELNDNPSNPQFKSYYVGWDGRNGAGQKVKTGIYFYTVNVGGRIGRNKIAVIQGSN